MYKLQEKIWSIASRPAQKSDLKKFRVEHQEKSQAARESSDFSITRCYECVVNSYTIPSTRSFVNVPTCVGQKFHVLISFHVLSRLPLISFRFFSCPACVLVVWLATCLADSRPAWLTRDLVGWLVTWLAGSRPVVWLATWLSDARPACLTRATLVGWLAPSGWLTRAFLLADSRLPVGWLRLSDSQPCWLTRSSPHDMTPSCPNFVPSHLKLRSSVYLNPMENPMENHISWGQIMSNP